MKINYGTLQLFYFDQNAFGRARANALIRKNDRFVLDFAPQHFEIDAEVAEIAQFAYRLAPALIRSRNLFPDRGTRKLLLSSPSILPHAAPSLHAN